MARLKRPAPDTKYHHFDDLRLATIPSTIAQGSAIKTAIHTSGTHCGRRTCGEPQSAIHEASSATNPTIPMVFPLASFGATDVYRDDSS